MFIYFIFMSLLVFTVFFILERIYPARTYPIAPHWSLWWSGLGIFSIIWLKILMYFWVDLNIKVEELYDLDGQNSFIEGIIFYLFYSLGNYWWHRLKHNNPILWRYLHQLHHCTSHMETRLAFFRHPLEIFANTIYLILIGKLIMNVSVEVIMFALAIEGSLEIFHHSNIRLPRYLKFIGYIIQTPEMHLVHHEYKLHRYNYSPFLWDLVFGTVYIPDEWNKTLGTSKSSEIWLLILCRK